MTPFRAELVAKPKKGAFRYKPDEPIGRAPLQQWTGKRWADVERAA